MESVNVREARQQIGRLLDAVAAGEDVAIVRRKKPVARLLRVEGETGPRGGERIGLRSAGVVQLRAERAR